MKDSSGQVLRAQWEGAAEAFCKTIRKVNQALIAKQWVSNNVTHRQDALSTYGVRGYGNHYDKHLERIDTAIALLERSRVLFVEAESLRNRILDD